MNQTPPILPPPDSEIMAAMKKYGGGFVHFLGQAALIADPENLAKIKDTWPEYWTKYEAMALKEQGIEAERCESCLGLHKRGESCRCAVCGCGLHPQFIVCRRVEKKFGSYLTNERQSWCPRCDEANPPKNTLFP